MKKRIRGIRVGSSDLKARRADLNEAHAEFEKLLANGWKIESVKRPRVKVEPTKPKRTPKMVIIIYKGSRMRIDFKALPNYRDATVEFEIY